MYDIRVKGKPGDNCRIEAAPNTLFLTIRYMRPAIHYSIILVINQLDAQNLVL